MKITYDENADAAYLRLDVASALGGVKNTVLCEPPLANGMVNLDFDQDGLLVGIEIVGAQALIPSSLLDTAERIM